MSARDSAELRDLAAAYALGSLAPEEARQIEAAMARDPALAEEVAAFREVSALLADAGGQLQPGPGLKARVLERIAAEKEARLAPATVAPVAAGSGQRRFPWAVAAAVALAVVATWLYRDLSRTRLDLIVARADLTLARDSLAERAAILATLLGAAEDLAVVHLTATDSEPPGLQLFWNRRTNQGVLHAYRLPPAAPGRAYQLWLIRDGVPVPSQVFNSGADGAALVANFTLPPGEGVTAAAVTEEPLGGSLQPTTPILLIGTLPTS